LQGGQALPGPPWREALQGGQVLPGLSGGKSRWEDKPSLALPKWKDFRRGQALPGLSGGKSRWEDKPSLALPGSLFGDANALHGLPRGRVIVCGSIHQRWQCNTVGARSLAHNVARCRASPRVAAQCRDATRRWSSPRNAAMPRGAGRRRAMPRGHAALVVAGKEGEMTSPLRAVPPCPRRRSVRGLRARQTKKKGGRLPSLLRC
jgi:hypothetical protein